MGIDIYMNWKGMTEAEASARYTGFSATAGGVGYMREAYHGEPYVTHDFVAESFDSEWCGHDECDCPEGVQIPAALLRERLPVALLTCANRYRTLYKKELDEGAPELRSYIEFVELAERKERETGEPVRVYASY